MALETLTESVDLPPVAASVEPAKINPGTLQRTTLRTSRLLDFCSRKELIAQTGHQPEDWPLVVLKELVDNGLDACEEAGIAPEITVCVDENGITVSDNGPGLLPEVVEGVLDFAVRVSSREAYVAPDRGAQGNALKTLVAMPFVIDGKIGQVEVDARGVRNEITFSVDPIRQQPVIRHERRDGLVRAGTLVTVHWPDSARSILHDAERRFLQIVDDYAWLNPSLTLTVDGFGKSTSVEATNPSWPKWRPSDPTSAHWYQPKHLERLIAGYVAHDEDQGRERTVRKFVSEFRGLSGTAKQKRVLEATGLGRASLSALRNGDGLNASLIETLLAVMKSNSTPVKPEQLGVIGKDHLQRRFLAAGCQMESFQYKRVAEYTDGIPWVIETAFGWCPKASGRRLVTGVNWSPGIVNPFRVLGRFGSSLDTILSQQRADADDPVILVLHMACPRVEYLDRGKSSVVVS
jgi:DNA topoisomerase VI subunit B